MSKVISQIKIVFLITASVLRPYSRLRYLGQEKTWVQDITKFPKMEYRYLLSNGNKAIEKNFREDLHTNNPRKAQFKPSELSLSKSDELVFEASFGWESILANTIAGIKWALENDQNFDFIVRTNVSSYWNLKSTIQMLERLPKSKVYAGHFVRALGTEFIAGDGMILSRDVAIALCKNSHLLDASVIDDVAIGRLMREIHVTPTHIPRKWVRTRFDINHPELLVGNTHLFRCKFERVVLKKIVRRDITLMKLLHNKFKA